MAKQDGWHQIFPRNRRGRDFFVGDLHGQWVGLKAALSNVDFECKHDRLFAVGDLVHKGKGSLPVLKRLADSGFPLYSVRGNHEQLLLRALKGERGCQRKVAELGGEAFWEKVSSPKAAKRWRTLIGAMPLAITVKQGGGRAIGVCHAGPPRQWPSSADFEPTAEQRRDLLHRRVHCQPRVKGIDLVLVGHTPTDGTPQWLGENTLNIDLGYSRRVDPEVLLLTADELLASQVAIRPPEAA